MGTELLSHQRRKFLETRNRSPRGSTVVKMQLVGINERVCRLLQGSEMGPGPGHCDGEMGKGRSPAPCGPSVLVEREKPAGLGEAPHISALGRWGDLMGCVREVQKKDEVPRPNFTSLAKLSPGLPGYAGG